MKGRRVIWRQRRFFSLTATVMLILSTLLLGIPTRVPNAKALDHNVGNLEILLLTDYGRVLCPLKWGELQSTNDPLTGIGPIGLVIDQDNYSHVPGSEDIADSFNIYPYASPDDLTTVSDITMVVDNGTTQKSIASFQNTGFGTGDPNDILIDQMALTVLNMDWAILQWNLINLKSSTLEGVCIGLELPLSQAGALYGLGGDSGDDIDGYDPRNATYWAQDDDGTTIGFASAIISDPITHYYSEDYHPANYDTYKVFWENDAWLYSRLHAPNSTVGATPGNRTSTVGWNDLALPAGSSITVTLVIAIGNTYNNMMIALKDAQNYYSKYLPPVAHTGLQANLVTNGKHVMLSWNASADDGSGHDDVVGYTIYKSITGVNGNYEFVDWIPATGSLSYNWIDIDAGDGDWNDYFYIVQANDTFNNEEQNTNKVGKVVNYLVEGWNLISVPLIQTNTSKDHVMQTLEANYSAIQTYHAGKSRPWLHWHRSKPNYLNTLTDIKEEDGYYIYMLSPDYLVVAGNVPIAPQIPLKTGWNLIGYPSLINRTRDDALSSISGMYNTVEFYNTNKGREEALGPGDLMYPGYGYWVHVDKNCNFIL